MKKRRVLWFKAKEYGWGWFPATWQGWLVTIAYTFLYTLAILVFAGWIGAAVEDRADTRDLLFGILEFVAVLAVLTYTLIRICLHRGEKPVWRWGKK